MLPVIVYGTASCPYCQMAKELLNKNNIPFTEYRVDLDASLKEEMLAKSQRKTVPQIFAGSHHIGGYTDLKDLYDQGTLLNLIQG